MISEFKHFIEKKIKLLLGNNVLLTVSGGADSVAMLHLFSVAGYNCGIAHCNFHLRGKESDLDEELVKKLASKYCFPFYKIDFDTRLYASENGLSIEMAARDLRYGWFEKIREENDYQYIATAHHQDDLIETFFINLTRGTGIRGLTGIKFKNEKLIRPMLFTDRDSIIKYVSDEKLEFREDRTNSDVKIIRNKFRHKILPLFQEINPAYKQNILQSVENLRDAEILMNNEVDKAQKELMETRGAATYINIDRLMAYHPIHPYLFELLQPFGFNSAQLKDIEVALNAGPGKLFFSKTHQLVKDRNTLIIQPLNENELFVTSISENDKQINLSSGKNLFINIITRTDEFIIPKDEKIASIDFDKIKFPLQIRKWEQGDYFYPFGMKQKKKISDFLIDEKLSLFEKQQLLLLLSENQVVWVIGKRIDERYRISEKTKRIVKISME